MPNNDKQLLDKIIYALLSTPSYRLLFVFGLFLILIASLGTIQIGSWIELKKLEDRIATGLIGSVLLTTSIFLERTSKQGNKGTSKQGNKEIAVFGYLFIEKDNREEILVNDQSIIERCDLPIFRVCKLNDNITIEESINQTIRDGIQKMGISDSKFLEAGVSKPIYYQLYKSEEKNREVQSLPYIFFKLKLNKKIEGSEPLWQSFSWKVKFQEVSRQWENEEAKSNHKLNDESLDIFKALTSNLYYESLNLKILECVDALIFRKNADADIEFLLIQRNVPNEKIRWEYPKGGIYYHETYLEGALREIQEETQLIINQLKYCCTLGWQTINVTDRNKYYDTLRVYGLVFLYTGHQKNIILDRNHSESKWATFDVARSLVKESEWLEGYALEFFDRFKAREEEIL